MTAKPKRRKLGSFIRGQGDDELLWAAEQAHQNFNERYASKLGAVNDQAEKRLLRQE